MNAAIWLAKSNYTKAKLKFYNPSSKFLNLYLQAKTEVYLSTFNWNLVDSKILQSDWPSAFSMKRRKNFTNHLLGFLNLHLHAKNEVIHWFLLELYRIQEFCNLIGWKHFSLIPNKNLKFIFCFLNLYLHTKYQIDLSLI